MLDFGDINPLVSLISAGLLEARPYAYDEGNRLVAVTKTDGSPLLKLEARWSRHLTADLDAETVRKLRRHEATGRPAGSERFVRRVERLLGRVLQPQKPGRPKHEPE